MLVSPHLQPTLQPLVRPGKVRLQDEDATPPDHLAHGKELDERIDQLLVRLEKLQHALGAEAKRALLVVLQGRDTAGKDGVIRKAFGRLNPATCTVTAFKRPSPNELRHDFLWRVHQAVPPAGAIGIFNRSHYEDVLVVRVHQLVPEALWRKRYDHINDFERLLADHGVTVLKFFLHISKEEQRQRLEERLADPTKNWKFEPGDLAERALWEPYTEAYQELLARCSTEWAPWYVVPADRKGARDLLLAEVLVAELERLDPKFPEPNPEVLKYRGTIV